MRVEAGDDFWETGLRQSSKTLLMICAVLLAFLIGVYFVERKDHRPEFTAQDAHRMLTEMAEAFERGSVKGTLAYVAEDAQIAGRRLERIEALLQQAFRYLQQPKVEVKEEQFTRHGDTADLHCHVTVRDMAGGASAVEYSQRIYFTIKRREIPRLWGLMTIYDWKITHVDAPNVPFGMTL